MLTARLRSSTKHFDRVSHIPESEHCGPVTTGGGQWLWDTVLRGSELVIGT